jgi:hypothetical protein
MSQQEERGSEMSQRERSDQGEGDANADRHRFLLNRTSPFP